MAIVKGLEEGAVLAKFTNKQRHNMRDPNNNFRFLHDENGRIQHEMVDIYFLVKLYSRRNRTNGCTIEENLYPFFQKLKIKLVPRRVTRKGKWSHVYTAVGCDIRQVDQTQYESAEVDEIAKKHFDKVKNEELLKLLDPHDEPELVIEGLRSILLEGDVETEAVELEEGEAAPAEPRFPEYHTNEMMWP